MRGYQSDFLSDSHQVPLPDDIIKKGVVLEYLHYSVVMDLERGFPLLTATNIDGSRFLSIPRNELFSGGGDKWKKDDRIERDHQWGMELYRAPKSDFDRGHMTKREDVQWGVTLEEAAEAARSTFYFTNAVPQHPRVNQSVWRSIEDYVLKSESVKGALKVSVFTGPVMNENDPDFVTEISGKKVQLPLLFWKIIYYINEDEVLSRVAFLVGQKYLLEKEGMIRRRYQPKVKRLRFMNFKKADTFQVEVPAVEELTEISFVKAHDPMTSEKPIKLVTEQVNVRGGNAEIRKGILIKGLKL
ncbi:MAG: DNA/RNA non-specific endonuclease [Saprospiraceae bacterium]|nr:DNA/RNA non-specific endonuclease [Saprospiraceae bacterium]